MKYLNLLIDFRSHEKKTKISIFVDVLDLWMFQSISNEFQFCPAKVVICADYIDYIE